jgi:hypothetical protein
MPDELALDLGDLHVVVVERGDDLRAPVLVEAAELLGEADPLLHADLLVTRAAARRVLG